LFVDDIVSSGGTLMTCGHALAMAGASSIDVVITHALFPAHLARDFARAGIRSIRSTSSVSHPTNAIMLDGILAGALSKETVA
jgi:ribose-phosphate pyrophosphokinase